MRFEFPLIAEIPNEEGRFRVQRPPVSRESAAQSVRLTSSELSVKLEAASRRYPSLRQQMGDVLDGSRPSTRLSSIFWKPATGFPYPGPSLPSATKNAATPFNVEDSSTG